MMQVLLGIHGLLGFVLFVWAIQVRNGESTDMLVPSLPGLGSGLAVVLWCFAWWLIARFKSQPPYASQPEARFHFLPAVLSLVSQVLICLCLAGSSIPSHPWMESLLWLELAVLIGGPFVLASWAFARIRFHVGTWALAWGIWIMGTIGAFGLLSRRWADC
jgi:hypothetical protein